MNPEISKYGLEIAETASEMLREFFRQAMSVDYKPDESPVTLADRAVERAVREAITGHFPDHGIFGEEEKRYKPHARAVWVIDPIDGTKSFVSGHPLFGFLVAFVEAGEPRMGIVAMPAIREIYCGVAGEGTTLNGAAVRTSGRQRLENSILYVNEGEKIHAARPDIFARLMQAGQVRRLSYDCYPHALLAAGHVDAVVDYDLKPYDFLALRPLVEAAGGVLTDWRGGAVGLEFEGPIVSAASPELHGQLVALLDGGS